MKLSSGWLWAAPTLVLLVGLLVSPLILLVRLSLSERGGGGGTFYRPDTWTGEVYTGLVRDRFFWELLGFTAWLGVAVTLLCVLFGYPTALFLWRLQGVWKWCGVAAVVIPKLSNLLVTVYGLKLILSDHGPVNTFFMAIGFASPLPLQNSVAGVVIGKTLIVLPYTILLIWLGLERVDRTWIAAARGLGATRWAAFWRVTFPLSFPALLTAALVSLVWGLGAFVSPFLLGSPQEITLAVDVQRQMFMNFDWPRGAAEGVALVLLLVFASLLFSLPVFLRRRA